MQIQTADKYRGYSESTEPIDAVNILPVARFEPTTSATPPSTTPDINATNCATEPHPKKDVQEAYIYICCGESSKDKLLINGWLDICKVQKKQNNTFQICPYF